MSRCASPRSYEACPARCRGWPPHRHRLQMVFVEADLQVAASLLDRLQYGLPGRVTVSG
jgi:hypothetical protein